MSPSRRRRFAVELASAGDLVAAIHEARARSLEPIDAYVPYPVEEAERALGLRRSRLPIAVCACACAGAMFGYVLQWWLEAHQYRLDVGARSPDEWPPYIPIAFETAVLFDGIAAFLGFLALARLPTLWAPIDDVPGFDRASNDRFWLLLEAEEPVALSRALSTTEVRR